MTLSQPSVEAEYHGVANAVVETCCAVYLSTNLVQHQRTKHIEIDIHFVRDMVVVGMVRVLYLPSRYEYAYILTKGLPSTFFEEFRTSLSIRYPPVEACKEGLLWRSEDIDDEGEEDEEGKGGSEIYSFGEIGVQVMTFMRRVFIDSRDNIRRGGDFLDEEEELE
ncbi:ribonuclease H-like domain-containing protein [Tanacetum coccineum]